MLTPQVPAATRRSLAAWASLFVCRSVTLAAKVAAVGLLAIAVAPPVHAQTAAFSDIADAVPGRCYDSATTRPDSTDPNRLIIGMNSGIVPGTFGTPAGCQATDSAPSVMDTIAFVVTAPDGFYVSRLSFTQMLATSGSRGGRGFAGSQWVVAGDARSAGGTAVADLIGQNKTVVPIKITTFLAAAGDSVRSGSATASNASVLVELAPLVGAPPPPPPIPPRNPVPVITTLSPSAVTERGPAFTVTVNGSGFVTGARVRLNGQDRQTTAVSGTQLRAAISAADIAAAGQAIVTVVNPPSGFYSPADGGVSNELPLTINTAPAANPVPVITSISPESAVTQSTTALTLTVNGSNFIHGSVVRYGGENRSTTYVSPNQLTATLGGLDLFTVATIPVTVFNPATGFNPPPDGGTSNAVSFRVTEVPPPPPPPPGEPPALANGNVDDKRGKEWRQLTATRGLSRFDVAALCPQAGPAPYRCSGRIGSVDLTDWVWATSSDVINLFSYFTGAITPTTPTASGLEFDLPASRFHGLFSLTQAASGCSTYQGCFDFRSVSGVTASINSTGGPIGGTVNRSQGFFGGFFGSLAVETISDDVSNGRGVYLWRPTGLGTGTAHAYNDEGQAPSPFGGAALRVMNNDWVAGALATPLIARVTVTSPVSPASDRITVGADGVVQVAAGATAGTYTFRYNLCTNSSDSCDDAEASVVVRSYAVVATNDQATATFGTGGSPVNVLTNDTINGQAVNLSVVSLRQVSSTHQGVSLNTSTGAVVVAAGTPGGTQSLAYEICELANPANCRQATVTLRANTIDAVNDVFAKVSKSGGSTPSVLINDRFNGGQATTANVQLSLLTPLPAGIALDLATGRFVVTQTESGDYPVMYQICEIGSPTNCDSASLVLEISGGGGN